MWHFARSRGDAGGLWRENHWPSCMKKISSLTWKERASADKTIIHGLYAMNFGRLPDARHAKKGTDSWSQSLYVVELSEF